MAWPLVEVGVSRRCPPGGLGLGDVAATTGPSLSVEGPDVEKGLLRLKQPFWTVSTSPMRTDFLSVPAAQVLD